MCSEPFGGLRCCRTVKTNTCRSRLRTLFNNKQIGKFKTETLHVRCLSILGDPEAASWGNGIFTGESLQQEWESP